VACIHSHTCIHIYLIFTYTYTLVFHIHSHTRIPLYFTYIHLTQTRTYTYIHVHTRTCIYMTYNNSNSSTYMACRHSDIPSEEFWIMIWPSIHSHWLSDSTLTLTLTHSPTHSLTHFTKYYNFYISSNSMVWGVRREMVLLTNVIEQIALSLIAVFTLYGYAFQLLIREAQYKKGKHSIGRLQYGIHRMGFCNAVMLLVVLVDFKGVNSLYPVLLYQIAFNLLTAICMYMCNGMCSVTMYKNSTP